MSLATNVADLATRIATEFKSVRSSIGSLAGLTTTDKTSVVNAVNELKTAVGGAGAQINDAVTNNTTTWSGSKTSTSIADARAAVKAEILGGAGAAFDTLSELKALVDQGDATDQASITALTTAVGNRVRFDAPQTLTAGQRTQALSNIGAPSTADVGPTDTNFVTAFEAGLV